MASNFVELKGSVFKKFDPENLFQIACSDIVERCGLIAVVYSYEAATSVRPAYMGMAGCMVHIHGWVSPCCHMALMQCAMPVGSG
jgi:hypothetical protein